MADPLSLAASIAGLIALASEVAGACRRCYSFHKAFRNGPKSLEKIVGEIQSLKKVLVNLQDIYNRRTHELPAVSTIVGDVEACRVELEILRDKLAKLAISSRVVDRLKWPYKEEDILALIARLQRFCIVFSTAQVSDNLSISMQSLSILTAMRSNMESVQMETESSVIASWLSPLDFVQRQSDLFNNRRHPTTGRWVLETPEILRWRSGSPNPAYKSLYLQGSPGVGKTILCSVIIRALERKCHRSPLAYVYCHFQEQGTQNPRNVLGSIAKQLAFHSDTPRSEDIQETLNRFYAKWKRQPPTTAALVRLIGQICGQLKQSYIVIDGIDEAESEMRKAIPALLKALKLNPTAILISGRPYIFDASELSSIGAAKLHVRSRQEEVIAFVRSQLKSNDNLRTLTAGNRRLEAAVVEKISSRASGQFALARMSIRNIAEEVCEADVMGALDRVGDSLPQEYEKSIARMRASPPRFRLAMKALAWLVSARMSLSPQALRDALAIDAEDLCLRADRRPSLRIIVDACLGFIVISEATNSVELFHFTAKEYLLSLPEIEIQIKSVIPQNPAIYLHYQDFAEPCKEGNELRDRVLRHPFATYASTFWADHARQSKESEGGAQVLAFLSSQNVFNSLQMLPATSPADVRLFGSSSDLQRQRNSSTSFGVFLAVCFRLPKAVENLIASGSSVSDGVPWGDRYTPLHAAVLLEDPGMCRILIRSGAKINLRDTFGLTPLHLILHLESSSELEIASLLCGAGADLGARDQDGDTPLHIASGLASPASVSMLISLGSDVNAQNDYGRTALHEAIIKERPEVVRILVANHADALKQDKEGVSPLRLSLGAGHYAAVEDLLQSARQNATSESCHEDIKAAEEFLSPLARNQAALQNKEKKNLGSYLSPEEFDAEKTRRDSLAFMARKYRSPGSNGSIHDLIVGVSNVNFIIDSSLGWTPLHVAARNDRERVVFHLLAAGAIADAKDHRGRTPRDLATSPAVKRLLENDDWLDETWVISTGKGSGLILGRKLREFYTRRRSELAKETIDPRWGGLLVDSGIQPTDFDSFSAEDESEEWKKRVEENTQKLLQQRQYAIMFKNAKRSR